MGYSDLDPAVHERRPWNAGQKVGPKRPLKPRDIWAIRFYLDEHKRLRDGHCLTWRSTMSARDNMLALSTSGFQPSGSTGANTAPHSLRRTKASLIYKATGNLRAVQILP